MRVRWTPTAAADFEEIYEYIQAHLPHFTKHTISTIYSNVQSLKRSPYIGRPGREKGTRELVLTPLPYIVIYSH